MRVLFVGDIFGKAGRRILREKLPGLLAEERIERQAGRAARPGGVVERLISPSSFQLKGSGWYATDYASGKGRNGKNGSGKKAETPAAKPAESKPSTSTETTAKS